MLTDEPVRELIEATNRTLVEPLRQLTLNEEVSFDLQAALEQNTFVFSGFKTHHELTEVAQLLKGDDGRFKPFNQFRTDIEALNQNYNGNYLRAEYNFATASTQMAAKWQQWAEDGDEYNLQYRTANDDRVREEHAALHGTTLPPSDPFWDSYLPPNGWNCRCTAVQVLKYKYPESDSARAIAAAAGITDTPKKQIFRFNPGKQMKVFPPKHPYLPKGCGDCQYKRLVFDSEKEVCRACLKVDAASVKWSREMTRKHYQKLIGEAKNIKWTIDNGGVDELTVTYQDIKNVTGKPHEYAYARNMATYYLRNLLNSKNAKYLGNTPDIKGNAAHGHTDETIWHYYEIRFLKGKSYLIIKEVNGKKYIHHIQDENHFDKNKIRNKSK